MKALVKSRSEPGLWLEDVPEPKIGMNDVLIRVLSNDVHFERGASRVRRTKG